VSRTRAWTAWELVGRIFAHLLWHVFLTVPPSGPQVSLTCRGVGKPAPNAGRCRSLASFAFASDLWGLTAAGGVEDLGDDAAEHAQEDGEHVVGDGEEGTQRDDRLG
jgi:hypothetical protein